MKRTRYRLPTPIEFKPRRSFAERISEVVLWLGLITIVACVLALAA